jgi:cell division transport system permease protein
VWVAFGLVSFAAAAVMIVALVGGLMAQDLTGRLSGSATVLVRGDGLESDAAAAARAVEILQSTRGVTRASTMEPNRADGTIADLIEARSPQGDAGPSRLLTVSFATREAPTAARIAEALKAEGLAASVDDNRLWSSHLWRAIEIAAGVAAAVWVFLALTAAFALGATSRACVDAHRDLIALLHLSGADDGHVAGLFRRRLGARAALAAGSGATLAILGAVAWRLTIGPSFSWVTLAAATPWPLLAVAAAVGAATLSTRTVLQPRP